MDNVVYLCAVTEYERGHGNRPDGYLMAVDRPSFDAKAKEINSYQGDEFSRTEAVRLAIVTPECYAELLATGKGWKWMPVNTTTGWLVDI